MRTFLCEMKLLFPMCCIILFHLNPPNKTTHKQRNDVILDVCGNEIQERNSAARTINPNPPSIVAGPPAGCDHHLCENE